MHLLYSSRFLALQPGPGHPHVSLQYLRHSLVACAYLSKGVKLDDLVGGHEDKNLILAVGVGQVWASAEVTGDDAIRDKQMR